MLDERIRCEDQQQQGALQSDGGIEPVALNGYAYLQSPVTLLQPDRYYCQNIKEYGRKEATDDQLGLMESEEIEWGLEKGGSDVIVHGFRSQADAGQHLAEELRDAGSQATFQQCDLTDIKALQAVLAETRAECGPASVLVNNAASKGSVY